MQSWRGFLSSSLSLSIIKRKGGVFSALEGFVDNFRLWTINHALSPPLTPLLTAPSSLSEEQGFNKNRL